MEALLRVQDLTVRYGVSQRRPLEALSGVSFALAAGEALGVLGESGSGKTTLAMAILGLLPKSASVARGAIIFRGTNLLALSEREWQKVRGAGISLVHQEPGLALNPVLRVGDQVAEVLRAHHDVTARQAREKSKELLAQVGLAAETRIDEAFPHQLSGGQRQRVVIAQAIAGRPALIIADEPTTALDTAVQLEIVALMRELQTKLGLALILIAHDPGVLMPVVQRIVVMYAGRIVEDGSTQQVLTAPSHPYTQSLLQCRLAALPQDRQARLTAIQGEPPDLAALAAGCVFAPRCPDRMDVCDSRPPVETRREGAQRVWCFKYEQ
jgi:oligopeptide/dipeptide ABC transporter ATP-binding protein